MQAAIAKGMNISGIARGLGLSRNTERKYAKATEPLRIQARPNGATMRQDWLDPFTADFAGQSD